MNRMKRQEELYPDYDVLSLQDEWDDHTRSIVIKRLGPFRLTLLSEWEQEMIKVIASHLAYDERDEVLTWVAAHVDQALAQPFGESQRKPNTPPRRTLIRDGLKALDNWAKSTHYKAFLHIKPDQQLQILRSLELGSLAQENTWDTVLQKELFQKLLGLIISAYYSHPWVWSDIGYGGPAYPRGYVRVELGLTDPWEPKSPAEGKGES